MKQEQGNGHLLKLPSVHCTIYKNSRFWFYLHALDPQDLWNQENSANLQALSDFPLFLFSVSLFVFPGLRFPCVAPAGFVALHSAAVQSLLCWPERSGDSIGSLSGWKYTADPECI